jgi:hypothetical protein
MRTRRAGEPKTRSRAGPLDLVTSLSRPARSLLAAAAFGQIIRESRSRPDLALELGADCLLAE